MNPHVFDMIKLADELWGKPPHPELNTFEEFRFGPRGAPSLNLQTGKWHDRDTDQGGNYTTLYRLRYPPNGKADEDAKPNGAASQHPEKPAILIPGLREFLAIEAWAERDIPEPDKFLGHLITSASRTFIVGHTGLGKTQIGFAMAVGMTSGTGFLHWRSDRPRRVLYIDGEMAGGLIKARANDALRRAGMPPAPGMLTIYNRDTEAALAKLFPNLGKLEPLNTEAGQNFIMALIAALGGVDVVIFDNVMALITGDQKDELAWSDTVSLVMRLTAAGISQIWIDHTGHATNRQYGSATKAWRFDTVAVMTPLPEDQREPREVAFTLSFDHPGKARQRTPENWAEFDPHIIRLREDRWTSEPVNKRGDTAAAENAKEPGHATIAEIVALAMTADRMPIKDVVPAVEDAKNVQARQARILIDKAIPLAPGAREVTIDGKVHRLWRVRTQTKLRSPALLARQVIGDNGNVVTLATNSEAPTP